MPKLMGYSILIGLIFLTGIIYGRAQSRTSSRRSSPGTSALAISGSAANKGPFRACEFSTCPGLGTTSPAFAATPPDRASETSPWEPRASSTISDGSGNLRARSGGATAGRNGGGTAGDPPIASGVNNASIVPEQARLLLFGSGLILIGGLLRHRRFGARE